MKCDYCGNEITPGTEVASDGHYFCNALHKSWYRGPVESPAVAATPTPAQAPVRRGISGKLIGAIATAVFVAIGSFVGSRLSSGFFGWGNSIDSDLSKTASELNKTLPMMVDRETRLDNAVAGAGRTFIYNYTLVNFTRDQLNPQQLGAALKPKIVNNVRTSDEMKHFRDKGVTLVYRYMDKAGVFVMEIKVGPEDYR